MASNSKDGSRKDGAEKSSAKKSSKIKSSVGKKSAADSASASAAKKASASKDDKEKGKKTTAKNKASSKSAVKSTGKRIVERLGIKKSPRNIRDFMAFLGDRYPRVQKILAREQAILEHFAFAIYLENGSFKQARRAFSEILKNFVDWNETRVSRTSEIVAVIGDIPKALQASEHLRWLLQTVFSANYDFSLEGLRQQDEKAVLEYFHTLPVATRFVADYVKFFALGGKEIPLSDGALRALRLLGFIKIDGDRERLDVQGRALTHEESCQLFFQLHELGAELKSDEKKADVLKLLTSFDKKVAERSEESTVSDEYKLYDSLLERYAIQKNQEFSSEPKSGDNATAESLDFNDSSVFDDEEDEYGSETDDFDVSESVVEAKMTSTETTFRESASKSFKANGSRGSSVSPNKRSISESDGRSETGVSKSLKKKSKDASIAGEDRTVSKGASASKNDVNTKNMRSAKAKKAEEVAGADVTSKKKTSASVSEKATPSRRSQVADASNVSASEPPDSRREEAERVVKTSRSASKSSRDNRVDDSHGKVVKRPKSKDASKKTSSRDASKLKEIQKKKPR